MPAKTLRSFNCPSTSERCKYVGCRRTFCLREAANGTGIGRKEAEDALRAYMAEAGQPGVKV